MILLTNDKLQKNVLVLTTKIIIFFVLYLEIILNLIIKDFSELRIKINERNYLELNFVTFAAYKIILK